jgi:hypothetical protein
LKIDIGMLRAPRRHVFQRQLDFMVPKIRDMYALYTSKESGRGKRRRLNALINEVVPRDVSYGGDVKPEYARGEHIAIPTKADKNCDMLKGYPRSVMLQHFYNGNEDAFNQAVADKDLFKRGNFYYVALQEQSIAPYEPRHGDEHRPGRASPPGHSRASGSTAPQAGAEEQ